MDVPNLLHVGTIKAANKHVMMHVKINHYPLTDPNISKYLITQPSININLITKKMPNYHDRLISIYYIFARKEMPHYSLANMGLTYHVRSHTLPDKHAGKK
ncbi:MAG: hypothetical protein ACI92E_003349 [Oceanicoccus sp.]|jgi:hypothetical protein